MVQCPAVGFGNGLRLRLGCSTEKLHINMCVNKITKTPGNASSSLRLFSSPDLLQLSGRTHLPSVALAASHSCSSGALDSESDIAMTATAAAIVGPGSSIITCCCLFIFSVYLALINLLLEWWIVVVAAVVILLLWPIVVVVVVGP